MNRYFYALMFAFLLSSIHAQTYTISGQVQNPYGTNLCDATVNLTLPNGTVLTIPTDSNGNYTFTGVSGDAQGTYTLSVEKDENPLNGVSTFDIVLAAKHILGQNILEPHQQLSMDVNGSNTNTTFDLVLIRRLVLGIDSNFAVPSWRFYASLGDWPTPGSSTPPVASQTINGLDEDKTGLNFFAIKTGDANGSAAGVCN